MNKTYSIFVLTCVLSIFVHNVSFAAHNSEFERIYPQHSYGSYGNRAESDYAYDGRNEPGDLFTRFMHANIGLTNAQAQATLNETYLSNRMAEQQLAIGEQTIAQANDTFFTYIQRPHVIVNILTALPAFGAVAMQVYQSFWGNAEVKESKKQKIEFNNIELEMARLKLAEAQQDFEDKKESQNANQLMCALTIQKAKNEISKNQQLLAISTKLAEFVEKKSRGQALTETEHESYTDYKKILKALTQINDQSRQARIPAGA